MANHRVRVAIAKFCAGLPVALADARGRAWVAAKEIFINTGRSARTSTKRARARRRSTSHDLAWRLTRLPLALGLVQQRTLALPALLVLARLLASVVHAHAEKRLALGAHALAGALLALARLALELAAAGLRVPGVEHGDGALLGEEARGDELGRGRDGRGGRDGGRERVDGGEVLQCDGAAVPWTD